MVLERGRAAGVDGRLVHAVANPRVSRTVPDEPPEPITGENRVNTRGLDVLLEERGLGDVRGRPMADRHCRPLPGSAARPAARIVAAGRPGARNGHFLKALCSEVVRDRPVTDGAAPDGVSGLAAVGLPVE